MQDGVEEERIPLGHLAPPWLPDSAVSMCQLCSVQFTVTRRRHHCRACGQVSSLFVEETVPYVVCVVVVLCQCAHGENVCLVRCVCVHMVKSVVARKICVCVCGGMYVCVCVCVCVCGVYMWVGKCDSESLLQFV